MAKKVTSQDINKRLEAARNSVKVLKEKKAQIEEEIKTKEALYQTLQAEYITRLLVENNCTLDDLEDLLKVSKSNEHQETGGGY